MNKEKFNERCNKFAYAFVAVGLVYACVYMHYERKLENRTLTQGESCTITIVSKAMTNIGRGYNVKYHIYYTIDGKEELGKFDWWKTIKQEDYEFLYIGEKLQAKYIPEEVEKTDCVIPLEFRVRPWREPVL